MLEILMYILHDQWWLLVLGWSFVGHFFWQIWVDFGSVVYLLHLVVQVQSVVTGVTKGCHTIVCVCIVGYEAEPTLAFWSLAAIPLEAVVFLGFLLLELNVEGECPVTPYTQFWLVRAWIHIGLLEATWVIHESEIWCMKGFATCTRVPRRCFFFFLWLGRISVFHRHLFLFSWCLKKGCEWSGKRWHCISFFLGKLGWCTFWLPWFCNIKFI